MPPPSHRDVTEQINDAFDAEQEELLALVSAGNLREDGSSDIDDDAGLSGLTAEATCIGRPQMWVAVEGFGDSGLIDVTRPPPESLFGTANTPRDVWTANAVLLIMVCCWICLTLAVRRILGPKNGISYASRIISLVHGVISTCYCAYTMLLRYRQFYSSSSFVRNLCCLPEPPLADEQFAALITASYFITDTLGLIFGGYFDLVFLFHHLGALVILCTSIYGRMMGLEIAVGIVILECTNPQLHTRWLLVEHKYDVRNPDGWLWWCCDTGFLASFVIARLFFGTVAAISFLLCPTAPFHIFCIASLFLAASAKFVRDALGKCRLGERWEG